MEAEGFFTLEHGVYDVVNVQGPRVYNTSASVEKHSPKAVYSLVGSFQNRYKDSSRRSDVSQLREELGPLNRKSYTHFKTQATTERHFDSSKGSLIHGPNTTSQYSSMIADHIPVTYSTNRKKNFSINIGNMYNQSSCYTDNSIYHCEEGETPKQFQIKISGEKCNESVLKTDRYPEYVYSDNIKGKSKTQRSFVEPDLNLLKVGPRPMMSKIILESEKKKIASKRLCNQTPQEYSIQGYPIIPKTESYNSGKKKMVDFGVKAIQPLSKTPH
jgi:hypothetical protein